MAFVVVAFFKSTSQQEVRVGLLAVLVGPGE